MKEVYSMRFTSNVATSSALILQMHVPSPFPTQYNVERSKELCLHGFNTIDGVGAEGRDLQCLLSNARIQFRVYLKALEPYNCPNTFVHDCRSGFGILCRTVELGFRIPSLS